ncbi:unnamed protein product [Ectocarpus sp. 12 AP-2014]
MATQDEKVKWVEGSPFMVDGFRFTNPRCRHYLLTHFHSDHTTGLYKSFSAGIIYCSHGTANLIVELMGVNRERVVALPMDTPVLVAGFELTLIDANHCPAAVMFVIRDPRPGGRTTLHTGDFRAAESVCRNPVVTSLKGRLDSLYLDTTYCGPRHTFPDQSEVLAQAAQLVRMELQRDPNTLFLVGTYSIGKEKVLEAVAKATGSRYDLDTNSPVTLREVLAKARAGGAPFTSVVGVRPTGWTHTNVRKGGGGGGKAGGIQSSIGGRAASAAAGGQAVRSGEEGRGEAGKEGSGITSSSKPQDSVGDDISGEPEFLPGWEEQDDEAAAWGAGLEEDGNEETMQVAANGVGVLPPPSSSSSSSSAVAGPAVGPWTGKKPWVDGVARVYSLPYSEHSSFTQLKDFVRTVRPKKIVPTVNAVSSASVEKMLSHFLEFMDLSSDRKRLESYFCKRDPPSTTASRGIDTLSSPGARASNPFSSPAEKRQKNANSSTGWPPNLFPAEKPSRPPLKAAERNCLHENDATSGTTMDDFSCVPRREGEVLRSRAGEQPCGDADPLPEATMTAEVAVPAAMPARSVVADAGTRASSTPSAVELDLVDVEAQKAIMADIERRKRGQQETNATGAHTSQSGGNSREGSRKSTPGSGRKRTNSSTRSDDGRPADASLRGFFGGNVVSDANGTRTRAESVGGCRVQEVLTIDDEDCGAETPEPMDIRDFFSRRK